MDAGIAAGVGDTSGVKAPKSFNQNHNPLPAVVKTTPLVATNGSAVTTMTDTSSVDSYLDSSAANNLKVPVNYGRCLQTRGATRMKWRRCRVITEWELD